MGDVINRAAHLANKAGRGWADPIWAGESFAQNFNEHNAGLLTKSNEYGMGSVRKGDVVDTPTNNWIDEIFD